MKFVAHPYQKRAIDFVLSHTHCLLFLDMGLGKSVITLTALSRLMDDIEVHRVLVIAPKSVAESTWLAEVEKWEHLSYLRVSRVIGTAKQRCRALQADADIFVLGRDNTAWLVTLFGRDLYKLFDTLVLDEITSFKNAKSQRFKAIRKVRGQFRRIIGLTGTPAPNGYLDLWAQVYCIDGGERLSHSLSRYQERYFVIDNPYVTWHTYSLAPGAQTTIEEKIADISLSMRAEDYLTLPDCIVIPYSVRLSAADKKRYDKFEKEQVLQFLAEAPTGEGNTANDKSIYATSAAALTSKLAQFANGAIYDENHDVHNVHDAKVTALLDVIEAAQSPVLVFYAFRHDCSRILNALPKHLSAREYTDTQDLTDWNAGKIDVLLAHPASTAYGLNMQQGGHIIVWFGLTWNLEHYLQANARLHRQGQTQPVRIYLLIADGTIDERASAALSSKNQTQNHLLDAVKALADKYK